MTDTHNGVTTDTRRNIVATRQTIRRVLRGDEADLDAAAAMLDAALKGMCPHGPFSWLTDRDKNGELLTTCSECNVSWYES